MRVIITFMLLALAALPAGAGTIKKWVDEHGTTHYGDSIPPEYAKQSSVELNSKGIVVKRTERAVTAEERKAQEEELVQSQTARQKEMEQQRHDKALLDTYTNEDEIDLARDRNLQQAEVQSKSAELRIKQVEDRLVRYHNQTAIITKANKAVPADLKQDIADAEQEIQHQKGILEQKKKDIEAVRARFEADKLRYRELMQKK